jgi:hypothetical protein
MRLTRAAIDKLRPDPAGRQKLYWDDELAGFGVLVSGKTKAKTFVVQKKLPDGRTRRVTIGPTNVFPRTEDARDRAVKVLAQFADGIDPKAARRAEAAAARIGPGPVCGSRLRAVWKMLRLIPEPKVRIRFPPAKSRPRTSRAKSNPLSPGTEGSNPALSSSESDEIGAYTLAESGPLLCVLICGLGSNLRRTGDERRRGWKGLNQFPRGVYLGAWRRSGKSSELNDGEAGHCGPK